MSSTVLDTDNSCNNLLNGKGKTKVYPDFKESILDTQMIMKSTKLDLNMEESPNV
jgi:hypothetical protein